MKQVYLNGRFLPQEEASISIFDRGFLFADAVYEVTTVIGGKLIDFPRHMSRLKRSLVEIGISQIPETEALLSIHQELIRRNRMKEGTLYLQVSRGAAPRDFSFPASSVPPTIVAFAQAKTLIGKGYKEEGQRVMTIEDLRWGRSDIKSVQLLYPCLVRNLACSRGLDDAWLVKDGYVTEGVSSNACIVTNDGVLVTRHLSSAILGGITRDAIVRAAREMGLALEERPFTVREAQLAAEAFSTSSPTFVNPVVEIDNVMIGTGKPGEIGKVLYQLYMQRALSEAL